LAITVICLPALVMPTRAEKPFAAGEHAGLGGPFTLFEFADQPPVAYAEGRGGSGRPVDAKHELEAASPAYDQLRAAALSPEASIGS
jgi:hypothetical protein